jgi:glyoxylase-like metal-dependent hydrolase (beta-lactamase superfamily II)
MTYETIHEYAGSDISVKNVGAVAGGDAFLIKAGPKAAVLEAGFSFCAGKLIENLQSQLQGAKLDYVLLTHSHYDHASGACFIKRRWGDVQILASSYAAKILSKPSALEVMREMNDSAAEHLGWDKGDLWAKLSWTGRLPRAI